MTGDEEIAEIAGVDPTPIDQPVDNEAIETAVNETAEQVAESTKEEDLAQVHQRKRIRRVGKIEVLRKPAVAGDSSYVQTPDPEIEALAADDSDPVRQEAATRLLAAEAAIPKVVSKHDEKWDFMFSKLMDFKLRFKHANVPQMYSEGPRLGRWAHYQRVEYWIYQETGGGKITPERIRRLEEVGFVWNPQEEQWKKMFERLKAYKEERGHCKVPKAYEKDVELANWVRNQRLEHANYLKGKNSRMNTERYQVSMNER